MARIIGLTGGIGSGKTTIARCIALSLMPVSAVYKLHLKALDFLPFSEKKKISGSSTNSKVEPDYDFDAKLEGLEAPIFIAKSNFST